ncbi:hypothetical protein CLG96_06790 [Sphingomonas oleivorans]|uniref:DUF429 domain-containing protein n=1 Tax=Sphingomonas oleivorans TaxID=1735121 RepID=A0A2T5FZY4_9SPHN|nr:hypothetical protein [Sphingomonas oleivorans]PTQ12248.1 hypothetical protein CLG96_06790 [Sphingomonas oleivorans]
MRRFRQFACIDWSGAAGEYQKGIALGLCREGEEAPELLSPPGGWSRAAILQWLLDRAADGSDILVGIDFSASLPFVDRGGFFPEWQESPTDAPALWALLDRLCATDAHLAAGSIPFHAQMGRHFRHRRAAETITGDLFEQRMGRFRRTELACRAGGFGHCVSSFNLIGAAQVGKSALTGMRLLHRLAGRVPIWPFDPLPPAGPAIVEIYTSIAARAAGGTRGRSKIRDGGALDRALAALDARAHRPLDRYDDHKTDALVTAAWLRRAAADPILWSPSALSPLIRRTEGWTFGVR